MNRLALPSETSTLPAHSVGWIGSVGKSPFRIVGCRDRVATTETEVTFSPIHYEEGYAYPLVVWLHGAEQSPRHLAEALRHISVRNYVAIAPMSDVGYEPQVSAVPWRQTPEEIASAQEKVWKAVSAAKSRFYINSNRIFLVGFDVGGTMAMRVGLQTPEEFAGVATIGGCFPTGLNPLSRINSIRNLPLLIAAARRSERYPEHKICEDLRLLHTAGATVSLRQYPGSNDLTTQMLADLDRWMMELIGQSNAAIIH